MSFPFPRQPKADEFSVLAEQCPVRLAFPGYDSRYSVPKQCYLPKGHASPKHKSYDGMKSLRDWEDERLADR